CPSTPRYPRHQLPSAGRGRRQTPPATSRRPRRRPSARRGPAWPDRGTGRPPGTRSLSSLHLTSPSGEGLGETPFQRGVSHIVNGSTVSSSVSRPSREEITRRRGGRGGGCR